jgi:actin-related protein 10
LESLLLLRAKVQGSDGQKVDLVDVIPKLSRGILEDIVVRTCFVTTLPKSRQLVASRTNEAGPSPPVPPPTILYPLSGTNNLTLDGSVREESAEVLFETDNEMVSLASMILDSILAVRTHR